MLRPVEEAKIGVLGLGYVGLPLTVALSQKFDVVGFDIDVTRIEELKAGHDRTCEVDDAKLAQSPITYSSDMQTLADRNVYIVALPTPIDVHKRPNLKAMHVASRAVGGVLKKDDVVIYESTVFPGATEEIMVPQLEQASGLTFNQDFYVGYSPERINPGDKKHTLQTIVKVTSGSTDDTADFVDAIYKAIIPAGTHKANSIQVAEAAKVIENVQRDLNIALVNELAKIFNSLNLDSKHVFDAASTKWNFLPFRPGLVGGHCIGVDPYYLTHRAQEYGYHPEIILAGRRVNDRMGGAVIAQVIKLMTKHRINLVDAKTLIMGMTFKENMPDVRNTRVVDLINELDTFGIDADVYDPWVDDKTKEDFAHLSFVDTPPEGQYDVIIVAVAHDLFKNMGIERIKKFGKKNHVVYDVKSIFPYTQVDGRL